MLAKNIFHILNNSVYARKSLFCSSLTWNLAKEPSFCLLNFTHIFQVSNPNTSPRKPIAPPPSKNKPTLYREQKQQPSVMENKLHRLADCVLEYDKHLLIALWLRSLPLTFPHLSSTFSNVLAAIYESFSLLYSFCFAYSQRVPSVPAFPAAFCVVVDTFNAD